MKLNISLLEITNTIFSILRMNFILFVYVAAHVSNSHFYTDSITFLGAGVPLRPGVKVKLN
jgi:hypothetical protein